MSASRDPLDALAALPPPHAPAMSRELEAELAALAPVRTRRPRRQVAALIAISALYALVLVGVARTRRDAGELPVAWLVGAGLAWLVGFVAPCYVALVPRAGGVIPSRRRAAIAAVVTAGTFVGLGFAIHPAGPSSVQHGAEHVLRGHGCLELGLLAAVVPVVVGALLVRGAVPVGSRWVAAALGAGGGSLGGLVLHVHCHVTDAIHLGVVHGGVVVLGAVLAAALVPRATDMR